MTVSFKQGDLEPALILDIYGENADLNGVDTWRVIGRMRGASELLIDDHSPTVVVDPADPQKAAVTHTWTVPQTAVVGLLQLEVEAMWPGDRPQSFPGEGFEEVRIASDLDPA